MAGFGRFKLTDALPEQPVEIEDSQSQAEVKRPRPRPGARAKAREEVNQRVPRASRRRKRTRRRAGPRGPGERPGQECRRARLATGWSTSAAATSKPAARAPSEPASSSLRGADGCGSRIWRGMWWSVFGAARGIGAAIAQAFAAERRTGRGHRSRPERPRPGQLASAVSRAWWPT